MVFIMQCAWCGKEFEPRRITQKYCSDKCRQRAKYENFCSRMNIEKREKKLEEIENIKELVVCYNEKCRFNSDKRKNHCIALADVEFKDSDCPFYKEKRVFKNKKIE